MIAPVPPPATPGAATDASLSQQASLPPQTHVTDVKPPPTRPTPAWPPHDHRCYPPATPPAPPLPPPAALPATSASVNPLLTTWGSKPARPHPRPPTPDQHGVGTSARHPPTRAHTCPHVPTPTHHSPPPTCTAAAAATAASMATAGSPPRRPFRAASAAALASLSNMRSPVSVLMGRPAADFSLSAWGVSKRNRAGVHVRASRHGHKGRRV